MKLGINNSDALYYGAGLVDGIMLGTSQVWTKYNTIIQNSFHGACQDLTSAVTFNFDNVPIALSAGDNRQLIVNVTGWDSSNTGSIVSSITVGGQTPTIVHSAKTTDNGNSWQVYATALAFNNISPTTDISVTFNSTALGCGIHVYSVENLDVPNTIALSNGGNGDSNLNVNTVSGGCVTAVAYRHVGSTTPVTWLGVDADFSCGYSDYTRHNSASKFTLTTETPRTVSIGLGENSVSLAVSWTPTKSTYINTSGFLILKTDDNLVVGNTETVTGSGKTFTFTVPADKTSLNICMIGAGGGGSASKGANIAGMTYTGGGYAGEVISTTMAVTPGQQIAVNLGTGGLGQICGPATSTTTNGLSGSATTFGALTANGGAGGTATGFKQIGGSVVRCIGWTTYVGANDVYAYAGEPGMGHTYNVGDTGSSSLQGKGLYVANNTYVGTYTGGTNIDGGGGGAGALQSANVVDAYAKGGTGGDGFIFISWQ